MELETHSDISRLMTLAFTFEHGEAEGEYLRELNPEWQKKKKAMSEQISRMTK